MVGETIEVKLKLKNDFNEDKDFEIAVYLYDLSEDESLEDLEDSIEIDEGKSEEIEFSLFCSIYEVLNCCEHVLRHELK